MIKSRSRDLQGGVARAAGKISIATTCSRVLGFIRDILLARLFGATGLTDAFFVAYRIPNLLRELFAEGSVSAGYVPVFTEYLSKEGREEARKLAGVVFAFLLSVLLIICLFGIILAPYITRIVAPNFVNNPEQFSLTVKLLRIMFPFLLFISLAALAMGTLNSLRVFFLPALAPAFFNLVMIASVLYLAPHFSVPVLAIAIGVTLGGAVQYGVQIWPLSKRGFNVRPHFSLSHPGLKKVLLLVLPVVTATGVMHINVLISNIFATYLAAGSVTYLYYGYRLILFPIGIFGISVAMALLPSLSEKAAKNDIDAVRDTFSFCLRLVLFTSIPAMTGLIALSGPIVNTLFQRDMFTYEATQGTVYALIFYSSGIWVFSGLRVVRAVFYSLQDTKTPLKVALLTVIINAFFCYVLIGPLKHGGLALALVIAASVNFFVLIAILRSKLGGIDGRRIAVTLLKVSSASFFMGCAGWFMLRGDMWRESGRTLEKSLLLASVIAVCVGLYLLFMYLMKSEELRYLLKMRKKSEIETGSH
jgi:putative peptidoglycan lipid II flippase